jgi:hypothetical protein|nr:MAG TPA: hypothetical protein [Caudoviricetes sp.]
MNIKEKIELIETLLTCNKYGNSEFAKRKIMEVCDEIKKELDRQALNKSIKKTNV